MTGEIRPKLFANRRIESLRHIHIDCPYFRNAPLALDRKFHHDGFDSVLLHQVTIDCQWCGRILIWVYCYVAVGQLFPLPRNPF